jgi:hypothetical protein
MVDGLPTQRSPWWRQPAAQEVTSSLAASHLGRLWDEYSFVHYNAEHDGPDSAALFTNLSPKVVDCGARHDAAKRSGFRVFPKVCGGARGALDVNAPVRLETTQGLARFTDARSGLLLAELPLKDGDP